MKMQKKIYYKLNLHRQKKERKQNEKYLKNLNYLHKCLAVKLNVI